MKFAICHLRQALLSGFCGCLTTYSGWNNQQSFLLIFIRTLEKQSDFQMKDRTRVAAMLMIALQDKLEYATIILQYLMVDMIESARQDQLKTLLRQSGTVAEKMLSFWCGSLDCCTKVLTFEQKF